MRTVQADSCLNYEQIDTLLKKCGGSRRGRGGGGHFGPEAKNLHVAVMGSFLGSCLQTDFIFCIYKLKLANLGVCASSHEHISKVPNLSLSCPLLKRTRWASTVSIVTIHLLKLSFGPRPPCPYLTTLR